MHIGFTSHLGSSPPRTRHPIHACAPVCCFLSVLFLVFFVFYLVSPFSFQPFLMSTSALNERSRSNPLCDFRLGTVVTSDYETPLTDRGCKLNIKFVDSASGNPEMVSLPKQLVPDAQVAFCRRVRLEH